MQSNLKLLIKFIIILKLVNQNRQLKLRQIKILLIFNLDGTALFFKLPCILDNNPIGKEIFKWKNNCYLKIFLKIFL
jgi:hypothetical protein